MLVNFLGEIDNLLLCFIKLIILDFTTGIINSILSGVKVSFKVGIYGIFKKILYIIVVSLANILNTAISTINIPIREIVIIFFLCTESLSVLENCGKYIPIPKFLLNVLNREVKNIQEKGGIEVGY